ncbi:MAG: hypothetical protein MZU79_06995 [Anaerotruncus sp.]|nr:hypothetical protein [Anaerotruncus sp.]
MGLIPRIDRGLKSLPNLRIIVAEWIGFVSIQRRRNGYASKGESSAELSRCDGLAFILAGDRCSVREPNNPGDDLTASFTYSPAAPTPGQTVQFTDSVDGIPELLAMGLRRRRHQHGPEPRARVLRAGGLFRQPHGSQRLRLRPGEPDGDRRSTPIRSSLPTG